uniref:Thaumatin-like protein n=1 Tax=Hordeum vulgare subsp. vulgare TaxID=112509 RepID=A0A8I6XT44_HORVV
MAGATRRAESAREFTLINQCKTEVWPAVTPGQSFRGGGYALGPGESVIFTAPVGWSGRVWGRTGCAFDSAGNGTCETGGCGTSLQCASASGAAPATLAEFTLASTDYYDVSLVDGFNLPVVVTPTPASANWTGCAPAGCDGDLRRGCPSELAVKGDGGKVVACRSACDVFGSWDRPVLLPRAVRQPGGLPADLLLQEVQGGVPRRLQLRLRRPLLHLHLRPVARLHHHLLLHQHEAIGVLVPQQPARLQRLRQEHLLSTNACDAAATLQLPGIAIRIPSVTNQLIKT